MKHLRTWALIVGLAGCASAWSADLYQEGQYRSLVGDVKAYRVGDSLTVLVMETSSAAQTADTTAKRKTDVGMNAVVDVGRQNRAGEINGHVNNDFSGAARTQRAGKLLAQITVTVMAVEANGDLRVSGEIGRA